jgi:Cyclic nucleotide-binding domain
VTALFLSRSDYAALADRLTPTALTLKRRVAQLVCARLRRRYAALAETLGDERAPGREAPIATGLETLPRGAAPEVAYLFRLPFFRAFTTSALDEVLRAGRFVRCRPGCTIASEGERPDACFVTINGAVEHVIARGECRIRVDLAGPGRALGCAYTIDGGPSSVAAVSRERTLLLAIPKASFEQVFGGDTAVSYAFLDAIQRDLVVALRQAERPQARLALFGDLVGLGSGSQARRG